MDKSKEILYPKFRVLHKRGRGVVVRLGAIVHVVADVGLCFALWAQHMPRKWSMVGHHMKPTTRKRTR
jgi:hypothetical protein